MIKNFCSDLKIHGFILVQYVHHVFWNRYFHHFSRIKIENFGIVGKRRLRTFIKSGLMPNFPLKKIFVIGSLIGSYPNPIWNLPWPEFVSYPNLGWYPNQYFGHTKIYQNNALVGKKNFLVEIGYHPTLTLIGSYPTIICKLP